jgi:lipopolysaccharide transport system permease protein
MSNIQEVGQLTSVVLGSPVTSPERSISIGASKGWIPIRLWDVWEHRELLLFFVWRDLKVRYKQTVLGAGWAIAQPLFSMVLFSLFFGRLAKVPSDGIPYPLFAFTGLVPWSYFANGLNQGSQSLVSNAGLIKKVYFPRLTIPVAKVLSALVDLMLAFLLLLGMTFYFGEHLTAKVLWLPAFVFLAMITALGAALWLSAMNVRFRDVEQVLPFVTQLWLFSTPIAYPSSLIPGRWRLVYSINPMVGVTEGFRWALLGAKTAPGPILTVSCVVAVLILISGAYWFRRLERNFSDVM